jgi:hypothetical protein
VLRNPLSESCEGHPQRAGQLEMAPIKKLMCMQNPRRLPFEKVVLKENRAKPKSAMVSTNVNTFLTPNISAIDILTYYFLCTGIHKASRASADRGIVGYGERGLPSKKWY